jgi:hypothetical protein
MTNWKVSPGAPAGGDCRGSALVDGKIYEVDLLFT